MPACRSITRGLGAVTLLAFVLAACGSDGERASPTTTMPAPESTTSTTVTPEATTTTTSAEPTTTAPLNEEAAILAAVDGFWRVLLEANEDRPDPDHPDLERYLTGAELERSRANTRERLDLGQAVRPSEPSRYSNSSVVTSSSAESATVRSSAIDDGILYDRASGATLNDAVVTQLVTMTLLREDSMWKVAETAVEQQWDGAVACD